jgi:hypothetical protein
MTYSLLHRFAMLGLVMLGISGCAAQKSATKTSNNSRANKGIHFALIGDMPYDALQTTNLFPNLIRELNATDLAFVVHDGDIKAGATPCTDDCFEAVRAQFQTIRHPLVYFVR